MTSLGGWTSTTGMINTPSELLGAGNGMFLQYILIDLIAFNLKLFLELLDLSLCQELFCIKKTNI